MMKLGNVQETMLIPLAIKANETLRPNARIRDEKAVEIIRELEADTDQYDKFMSHEGVIARTIMFDRTLKVLLEKHPDACCVNLGCGLDARFDRVDNGRLLWYDIDLPDAMAVRKQFFQEQERVKQISGSILEDGWTREIEKGRFMIFLIEGVLMYFSKEQVQCLLGILSYAFPEFVLLAELMPPFTSKMSKHHDTIKNTKAVFGWGTKSGKELEELCPGLTLIRENSFNDVMKKYTFRGWLFGTLPKIRDFNNRLAVYRR
ncbi:MAG: class I SAM-dependent methyltransferase [Lachnospiraceae bacterium]|nr:class I SAM-dependent methyltransferase [Lachnospiraceae bacterium]